MIPTEGLSPILPAETFRSPIWIRPDKNVPQVKTTEEVEIVVPSLRVTPETLLFFFSTDTTSPVIKNKFFKDLISESEKIYFGGPVMLHEACVLSENDNSNILFDVSEKIKLSNDLDLIQKILFDDKTPKNTKLIFGHAAWDTDQLNNEIKRGDWLVSRSMEQIFTMNPKLIWGSLIKNFGLDRLNIAGVGGVS